MSVRRQLFVNSNNNSNTNVNLGSNYDDINVSIFGGSLMELRSLRRQLVLKNFNLTNTQRKKLLVNIDTKTSNIHKKIANFIPRVRNIKTLELEFQSLQGIPTWTVPQVLQEYNLALRNIPGPLINETIMAERQRFAHEERAYRQRINLFREQYYNASAPNSQIKPTNISKVNTNTKMVLGRVSNSRDNLPGFYNKKTGKFKTNMLNNLSHYKGQLEDSMNGDELNLSRNNLYVVVGERKPHIYKKQTLINLVKHAKQSKKKKVNVMSGEKIPLDGFKIAPLPNSIRAHIKKLLVNK